MITSMEGNQQEEIENAERCLEWAKSLFVSKNIACDIHLLSSGMSPGKDLVEFAKDNKIDEIIVGVKRRSKVGKLLLGSTAQFVILEANCPVVSVK
ncbi:MAG: universal stress protein [Syntrophales bacterium]|nr:universal stress protein [Syntrophales bacterium]